MTIEERLANVELQLDHVKRRNRWLLGAILLVSGGLIVPTALEMTAFRARAQVRTAKEIRASMFVLEDESGKVQAEMGASLDGPELRMYHTGTMRVRLGLIKKIPSLWLMDDNGIARVQLNIGRDRPNLTLSDEKGKGRADLSLFEGDPGVVLRDEQGQGRAQLSLRKGLSSLVLVDEKGVARLLAGGARIGKIGIDYPESSLILLGPDGNVIWSAIK